MSDTFMTVNDVAELLQLCPQTIYSKIARNRIPFYRVGTSIRFRRSEIEEWVNAGHHRGVDRLAMHATADADNGPGSTL